MQATSIGWRVQLCTGSALGVMALAAMRVDILNNWEYGRTISAEMATILAMAAVAVVAVPTAASVVGWSKHLKITTTVCVVLTVWSALMAYTLKQGREILAAEAQASAYATAKQDEASARAILAKITELGQVEELTKLAAQARTDKDRACRRSWTDECTQATEAEKKLTTRLSDAKARDKAQTTLDIAKQDAKTGPAEASMIATVIGERTGLNADSVARWIALILTLLGIGVTQLLALLGGYSATLIGGALAARAAHKTPTAAPVTLHAYTVAAAKPVTTKYAPMPSIEPSAVVKTEAQVFSQIVAMIKHAGGELSISQRALADKLEIGKSTMNGYFKRWTNAGKIEMTASSQQTVLRLPKVGV